ncbi:MAG TPA: hypothetical protein ENK48_08555 [Gammaproteobacteria bacterium]|nr:hypothetical protein [Gammaproteobacteria bacterium]
MQKGKNMMMAGVLALLLAPGLVMAGEGHGMEKDGKGMSRMMERMQARHEMMTEMMAMMKETMAILKDLDHHPSDEEKARLGKMMKRMDALMAQHDRMFREMMEHMRGGHKGMMDKKEDGKGHHMM